MSDKNKESRGNKMIGHLAPATNCHLCQQEPALTSEQLCLSCHENLSAPFRCGTTPRDEYSSLGAAIDILRESYVQVFPGDLESAAMIVRIGQYLRHQANSMKWFATLRLRVAPARREENSSADNHWSTQDTGRYFNYTPARETRL